MSVYKKPQPNKTDPQTNRNFITIFLKYIIIALKILPKLKKKNKAKDK